MCSPGGLCSWQAALASEEVAGDFCSPHPRASLFPCGKCEFPDGHWRLSLVSEDLSQKVSQCWQMLASLENPKIKWASKMYCGLRERM